MEKIFNVLFWHFKDYYTLLYLSTCPHNSCADQLAAPVLLKTNYSA